MTDDLPELRASDSERDQAVTRLREGAAEGRLTLEEFHAADDARLRGADARRARGADA